MGTSAPEPQKIKICIHLVSGPTLDGFIWQGSEIEYENGWVRYSVTNDMGTAVYVNKDHIEYIEVAGI